MNAENNENDKFSKKEIFEIALAARNFEIKMFWQRCNYFLLLNTSVGVGVGAVIVSGKGKILIPFLCIIGLFVCLAWIKVGLGAKYWQSYWEQVLIDFQDKVGLASSIPSAKKPCEDKDVFSQPKYAEHVERRVRESLGIECETKKEKCTVIKEICLFICLFIPFYSKFYKKGVLGKPSVSGWMHRTACFFFLVWVLGLGLGLIFFFNSALFCSIINK